MGSWGYGIMQSDRALDLEAELYELALNDGDYTEYLASAHESEKNPRGVAIEHFRCLAQMYYPGVPSKNQDDSLLARLFKS